MCDVCAIWMNWDACLFPVNLKRRVIRMFMENLGGFGASSSWSKMTDEEEGLLQFSLSLPPGSWEEMGLSRLPNGDILCILFAEPKCYCLSMAFNILLGLPGVHAPASLMDELIAFVVAVCTGNEGMVFDCLRDARLKLNAG